MSKSSSMSRLRQLVRSQFEQEYGLPMRTVKAALHHEFGQQTSETAPNRARMVGIFVGVAAARRGVSIESLAHSVGMSLEDAGLLVQGLLPDDAFSDSLLNRLAHSIEYEVEFLRLMLGRSSVGA